MPKTYFASDFHLGTDYGDDTSRERERRIVRWLDQCARDADAIYLVGDVFDFWFEYKRVVPRGFVRLLGKLAELSDGGLPLYFFTGNHDLWMRTYFEEELGIPTYRAPIRRTIYGKSMMIGHGDGLGPGDKGYKRMKKVFVHPMAKWLYRQVHPDTGIGVADFWSHRSRNTQPAPRGFLGPEGEWLVAYCERKIEQEEIDYFVFGHRHLPIDHTLSNGTSRYLNLGEWMTYRSYGILHDSGEMEVAFFENEAGQIFG